MPKIAIGSGELAALWVGSVEVVAAYLGGEQVYEKASELTPVTFSYRNHYGDEVDRTNYTFAGCDIGTAGATRRVLIAYEYNPNSATQVASATIAGVGATLHGECSFAGRCVGFLSAAVPSGTTGTVVLNFNGECHRCGIDVIATYDMAATHTDIEEDESSPFSQSLSVPEGGAAFGASYANYNSNYGWSGIAELAESQITDSAGERCSVAGSTFAEAGTPTISCTGPSLDPAFLVISFGPA